MATMEQEPGRTLGRLEGRLEEQSSAIGSMQQQLLELGRRIDTGLQEVRAGQRQILIANWIIGGGIITALIGGLVTMIVFMVKGP